jgi:hypothetical protein
MRVQFQSFHGFEELGAILRGDGWHVEGAPSERMLAWHPEAQDAPSVRSRLLRLGLLTAHSVRIDLEPGEDPHHTRARRPHCLPRKRG